MYVSLELYMHNSARMIHLGYMLLFQTLVEPAFKFMALKRVEHWLSKVGHYNNQGIRYPCQNWIPWIPDPLNLFTVLALNLHAILYATFKSWEWLWIWLYLNYIKECLLATR